MARVGADGMRETVAARKGLRACLPARRNARATGMLGVGDTAVRGGRLPSSNGRDGARPSKG